jgi:hypothetical protein
MAYVSEIQTIYSDNHNRNYGPYTTLKISLDEKDDRKIVTIKVYNPNTTIGFILSCCSTSSEKLILSCNGMEMLDNDETISNYGLWAPIGGPVELVASTQKIVSVIITDFYSDKKTMLWVDVNTTINKLLYQIVGYKYNTLYVWVSDDINDELKDLDISLEGLNHRIKIILKSKVDFYLR